MAVLAVSRQVETELHLVARLQLEEVRYLGVLQHVIQEIAVQTVVSVTAAVPRSGAAVAVAATTAVRAAARLPVRAVLHMRERELVVSAIPTDRKQVTVV